MSAIPAPPPGSPPVPQQCPGLAPTDPIEPDCEAVPLTWTVDRVESNLALDGPGLGAVPGTPNEWGSGSNGGWATGREAMPRRAVQTAADPPVWAEAVSLPMIVKARAEEKATVAMPASNRLVRSPFVAMSRSPGRGLRRIRLGNGSLRTPPGKDARSTCGGGDRRQRTRGASSIPL